jgi:hypothetical protein
MYKESRTHASEQSKGLTRDLILALGLLFTTASQLRVSGVPVGPGELGLVIWIAAVAAKALTSGAPPLSRTVSALLLFWGIFALALSIGMITALATGEAFEPELVVHDLIAYILVAVVSCLCASAPARLRRIAWLLVTNGAVSLLLQLANGGGLLQIPGLDPWFWERFRGWSDNPNQLAILCLVLMLVAWYLADTAANLSSRLAAMALMIPPLVVGRLSQSDTFMLAVAVALPVWVVAKLIVCANQDRFKGSLGATTARLFLVAIPILLLCIAPVVLSRADFVKGFVLGFAKNAGAEAADETNLRMNLWGEALHRGIESGMLGLGPGPHLQIPLSIVADHVNLSAEHAGVAHPIQNGTANYEAHNSVLDVFTQGGLLAVASFFWVLTRATKQVYRTRSAGLAAVIVGAVIFMMTGNIVRQPILWFAIVLCLVAPAYSVKPRRTAPIAM